MSAMDRAPDVMFSPSREGKLCGPGSSLAAGAAHNCCGMLFGWRLTHPGGSDIEMHPIWCTSGIVVSLMVYGVLQERIMTTVYAPGGALYRSSVVLVLLNRLCTLLLACVLSLVERQPIRPLAPLYSYGSISVANVLATTCQYDALKYVSFPVATLGKCAKMIPVMVWGTFMNRKRYSHVEYIIATIITLGCTMFVLTGDIKSRALTSHAMEGVEYLYGGLLMTTYLTFDGVTSTLQERLFRGHRDMSIYNQIIFCCIVSTAISASAAVSSGQLGAALAFVRQYPACIWDIAGLSVSAATAQLFISYTIKKHGALTFATVMTTRQFLSILVSCAVFLHPLSHGQWVSTAVIFAALYYKINNRKEKLQSAVKSLAVKVSCDDLRAIVDHELNEEDRKGHPKRSMSQAAGEMDQERGNRGDLRA